MKIRLLIIIGIIFSGGFVTTIPHAYADCNINTDWSDAPCLDEIINSRYQQHLVEKWTDYYSYKGSIFMEEKYLELNQSIKENRLHEWVDESITHRSVYEYYFFSGRAPNTGEYHGQFDVIKINEENVPEYSESYFPNMMPLVSYDYELIYITILLIAGIIGSLIVGIVLIVRRKKIKKTNKIILIAGISVVIVVGGIVMGPVIYMIVAIQYSGFIISSTPDSVFEEEFAEIPEVAFFIEKYPNYTTGHLQDIIGWKIIFYESKGEDNKSINLEAKKSVLHHGVKISAGCNEGGFGFALNVPQEKVMDYLQNDECLGK